MKKVDLKDGEQLVIKSTDGSEFVYDDSGLHQRDAKGSMKISVLKSMRTEAGAKDWMRLKGQKDAKVVDTDTLKGMYDGEEYLPELGYHVVMEEPIDMEAMSSGEFKDVLKALQSSGYVEIDEYGPCLSDKWYKGVSSVMKEALSNVLKSVSEINEDGLSSLTRTQQDFVSLVVDVTKSLEDSEALARMSGAPENADTGHERRPDRSISDSEVDSAEQREASGAVAGPGGEDASDPKMDGDEISDSEADTATHLGDHNQGDSGVTREEMSVKKSAKKKTEKGWTGPDASGPYDDEEDEEEEPHPMSGHSWGDAPDYDKAEKSVVNTTFKSLSEARAWQNPSPEEYHVVPTSFEDKQKYGRNKAFIVKPRAPKAIFGSHGNKIV